MKTTAGSFHLKQPYVNCKVDYILTIIEPRANWNEKNTSLELKISVTNNDTGKLKTKNVYAGTASDPQIAAQELINEYAQILAYQLAQDEEARRQHTTTEVWQTWQKTND